MTDRDTITLPREVAYQVPLHELLESVPSDARLVIDDADGKGTRFIPVGRLCREAATILRTALAAETPRHPGYIIGSHWLETAYSRICAGEAEADVLRDIGLVRITDGTVETADIDAIVDHQKALRRDAERYRWGVENARWVRHEHEAYVAIPVAVDADLSCTPMRTAAIDAAMEASTAPASAAADSSTAPKVKP